MVSYVLYVRAHGENAIRFGHLSCSVCLRAAICQGDDKIACGATFNARILAFTDFTGCEIMLKGGLPGIEVDGHARNPADWLKASHDASQMARMLPS